MGAKAIKLGSWDKHPAYCKDLKVNVWHMRNGINVMVYFNQIEERSSQLLRNLNSCEKKA